MITSDLLIFFDFILNESIKSNKRFLAIFQYNFPSIAFSDWIMSIWHTKFNSFFKITASITHTINVTKLEQISMYRINISSFVHQFPKPCDILKYFSNSNDVLALALLSLYIHSCEWSSIRANKAVLPVFQKNADRSYYKHEVTIFLLKTMNYKFSKDTLHFGFLQLLYFFSLSF